MSIAGRSPPADRPMFPGKSQEAEHKGFSTNVVGGVGVGEQCHLLASTGPGSYDTPHIPFVQSYVIDLHHLG